MKLNIISQLLEQQFFNVATRQAPLSESIRHGAQLMLQKSVELEVTEFQRREALLPEWGRTAPGLP